jgi:hypothetical protein
MRSIIFGVVILAGIFWGTNPISWAGLIVLAIVWIVSILIDLSDIKNTGTPKA